jgi:uncharacterized damage-inducible protein DinB
MKELLLQLARYNAWANGKMIDLLKTVPAPLLDQELASSFPSLRKTVLHVWSAEDIWLQRLLLAEHPVFAADGFRGGNDQLLQAWQKTDTDLVAFVEKQYDDRSFEHICQYYNLQKKSFKQPVGEILLHLFNHSTYHRGQIVTLLHQAGVTKIPATDFVVFQRTRGK